MSPDLELAADRRLLGRTSTVERLADILRTRIIEGFFSPGERLAEDSIGSALGVSRNTLREAFRLLTHERLLVHELNRGVFVCKLTVDDLVDLYRVRKLVECGAVRGLDGHPPEADRVAAMATAVAQGDDAMRASDWRGLGTANMLFHQGIAALAGSPRVDELMRGVLAELRLHFQSMSDPRRFHEPYLERNREVLSVIETGAGQAAERVLRMYLDDSEHQLVEAYRAAAR
ncbi:MAG: FCD domain-containing protein [Actinophytocola sp.]|uniref:GntR family transcriptional regulator n=1 Tax=Actinophytocola sp. TaxID=1872138 RepID=UPI00132308BD|nr:GntR family transcriptional regulator [Actinophytocola sp.]MPZ84632.1 FCD domain-containing protein [Actinophytocola sp.]